MVVISPETFAKNGVYAIRQSKKNKEPILWIRIKDIGKKLDVKNIFSLVDEEIKGKFDSKKPKKQQIKNYKRNGSELIKSEKFMYAHECIMIPIIMHCGVATPKSIEFRLRFGFNQSDIRFSKKQLTVKPIMDAFEGENMQDQYTILGYRIELDFHDYKLAVEIDEKGHMNRDIKGEIQRQKALKKELNCEFIRINPDKENFDIFKAINEIRRRIKESTKN